MIYLDTSALIKLYLLETGSEDVQKWVESQNDPLPVWSLQEMELINAFNLKVFWKEITVAKADRQMEFFRDRRRRGLYFTPEVNPVALLESFIRLSEISRDIGCRTLDIQHVACALQLRPAKFISYDGRQRTLAAKTGLSVLPESIPPA